MRSRKLAHVRDAHRASGKTRTSARRSASRRRTRTARCSASRSMPNASAQERARHRQLVVVAEPAVDVDRETFAVMPSRFHQRDDAVDVGARQRRHVLAEIDREVGFAIVLVGGERRARHLAQDLLADGREPRAIGGALASLDAEAPHEPAAPRRRGASRTRRSRRPRASPATCARCGRTSRRAGR